MTSFFAQSAKKGSPSVFLLCIFIDIAFLAKNDIINLCTLKVWRIFVLHRKR